MDGVQGRSTGEHDPAGEATGTPGLEGAERPGAAETEEAEMMERLQEEIRNLPVSEHVLYMMHSLSSLAATRMGLAPDAEGGRDLEQARLAIDAFKALLETVERVRPKEETGAQRGLLSQLQLAYVAALGTAAPPSPAAGDAPPSEAAAPAGDDSPSGGRPD